MKWQSREVGSAYSQEVNRTQCPHGSCVSYPLQQRDLTEILAWAQRGHDLLLFAELSAHLDLSGDNDVEPLGQFSLVKDCLTRFIVGSRGPLASRKVLIDDVAAEQQLLVPVLQQPHLAVEARGL